MPTRYLKESICTSDNLARLSAEAERFWYRLLVKVDDFGRFDARTPILRAACFPLMLDTVSDRHIDAWLNELLAAGLLRVYKVNDRPYLEVITFREHNQPRSQTSKYPAPSANADTCMQMPANADGCLQIPSESESESESESKTKNAAQNGASAGANAPVLDPFATCLRYLDDSHANKPAALARLYSLRFGDTYPPNHARLGKMAKELSGDYKALARIIWSASVPEGDPHDYLGAILSKSKARRVTAEIPAEVY